MTRPIHPPERISWTCPLGLRFFDAATAAQVGDGLIVTATRADMPAATLRSLLTPGGIHAFHRLPGLPVVDPPDQPDPWSPPPATREYRIEVTDAAEQFLPCTFVVEAPFRGFATPQLGDSPPISTHAGIPLFSSPARRVPPGCVALRASLHEFDTGAPAAWAVVELTYVSAGLRLVARGMADEHGELLALFPAPEGPRRGFASSPPTSARTTQFSAEVRFHYESQAPAEERADYGRRLVALPADAFTASSPHRLVAEALLVLGEENSLGTLELAAT